MKVNILLVDDRPEGLLALEAVLNNPDYNLVKANSGEQALARVLEIDFAVILLDVQMPGMDGFETASLIKQRERSKDIPIIFVTAISKEAHFVYRGYEAGAVDYLFKPFDPHILKSKVAVYVDLHRKNHQIKMQAEALRESERRERARQLAALELESLSRYRNLADAVPHIVWKCQVDGTLDYCNRVWTNYTGLGLDQSSGNGWKTAFHPEDLRQLEATWAMATVRGESFETECRIRRQDDKKFRWHLLRAVPEYYAANNVSSWVATATDIHDRKAMERDLIRAKDEAAAANRAKSNFLANMSHEIRTPLGAVLGFAELMANPDQTQAERLHCLATIKRNGELLSRLISDILDLSKVEAGHLQIERVQFPLPDTIVAVVGTLDQTAKEKGITLDLKTAGMLPAKIHSDPTRLRQILFNIIGNAIKFTQKGGVHVEVKYDRPSNKMQIDVTDEGTGIEAAQAEKIFKPFMQADSSTTRKFGGTGLGLSLSRKLARALGGDVELTRSEPGKGSTFSVTIDAGSVDGEVFVQGVQWPLDLKNQRPSAATQSRSLDGIHILLVEDSQDNQVLLTRFLTLAGAKVEVAENGEEGVKKALGGDHHVVLMDIQMPVLDGYQATQQLRQSAFEKPILALTAHALKEERERCLQVGCDDHLTKPVDRKALLDIVASYAQKTMLKAAAVTEDRISVH
ncbi:MAG TPA: response regulator [Bdellovibrionales bacterium]|nr:response regulator [Bdellovibrionales bacterium]